MSSVPAGSSYAAGNINTSIDDAIATSNSTTWTATESGAVMTITAVLVSGRNYMVEVSACVGTDAVVYPLTAANAESASLRIREDSSTGTQIAQAQVFIPTTSSVGFATGCRAKYTAVASASKTFVVTGQRSNVSTSNQGIKAASSRTSVFTVTLMNEV